MNLQEELEKLFNSGDISEESNTDAAPLLKEKGVPIETLIDIVQKGGAVKTGIDVISRKGVLLLEKNVRINTIKPLLIIRQNGIFQVPISQKNQGGLWDRDGNRVALATEDTEPQKAEKARANTFELSPVIPSIEARVREINEMKAEATEKYKKAKKNIRKTIEKMKKTGGLFDMKTVEDTVTELNMFLMEKESAFSLLTKEIFLSEDFLLNHSINVCTGGLAILKKFNAHFSDSINAHLNKVDLEKPSGNEEKAGSFTYYFPEEIKDMAIGFFLHDIGKTAIPESIMNKPSQLTAKEYEVVKTHSYKQGMAILNKNKVSNSIIQNIVKYHHTPLYPEERDGYPLGRAPNELPAYVKVCKIADIYDAMTSIRSYADALNPIRVVTRIFRTYAQRDPMLQFILHAFVDTVGLCPPGSVVYLTNQQMAYVIDSHGPIVLPFTDAHGQTLRTKADPIDFGDDSRSHVNLAIDSREPRISPKEAYQSLPSFLKDLVFSSAM